MTDPLNIRPTQLSEHTAFSRLAKRSKQYWGYPDEYLELWDEELTYTEQDLRFDRHDYYSGWLGDELVGFCSVSIPERDSLQALVRPWPDNLPAVDECLELYAMFVHPDYIGQGYGGVLLRHAMGEAERMNAAGLLIQSEPRAQGFYQHHGAIKVGAYHSKFIAGRELPMMLIALPGSSG